MQLFRLFFIALLIMHCLVTLRSQEAIQYAKVKVNLIGRDIKDLSKAGLETDHGIYVKNRYLINDFSNTEIALIQKLGFEIEILIEDVVSFYAKKNRISDIDQTLLSTRAALCKDALVKVYDYTTPSQYKSGSMAGYFTYKEMLDILDTMRARYPQLITQRAQIGEFTTYEGNALYYVKVANDADTENNVEPKVLYTALHHAREPNSLSQMIFYLWYLLENYDSDPLVKYIVDHTQMYFIPCINPDGYLQNERSNPSGGGLWRKNMWRDSLGQLKGVDLNRNYGFSWAFDDAGSSSNPNSQTYRGKGEFSEPETQAVRSLCLDHDFAIALNYHTFGNLLVHPWGFNDKETDEDALFKSVGALINKENGFKLGTGTQTVGYVVNGDSDDWMYGEKAEKKAIYAYTPEVGPSFWPAEVDIDYLNRSCVWMNLSTALVPLNVYTAKEVNGMSFLNQSNKNIHVEISRIGFQNGSATVQLRSLTSGVQVVEAAQVIDLPLLGKKVLTYTLDFNAFTDYPDGMKFELIVDNNGFVTKEVIVKDWLRGKLATVYTDQIADISKFSASAWDVTTSTFYSGPYALTDSPNGNYLPSTKSAVSIAQAFDLSSAKSAILTFYAKWDVEDNYDYVQILASTDNLNFTPLCGRYTNLGSDNQDLGQPLYDGVQETWVLEDVDLFDYLGQDQVWIKFEMNSDLFEERDGFYIDDIELVQTVSTVGVESESESTQISVFPSIIQGNDILHLVSNDLDEAILFQLFDQYGRQIWASMTNNNILDVSGAQLANGLYIYKLIRNNQALKVGKLLVMD